MGASSTCSCQTSQGLAAKYLLLRDSLAVHSVVVEGDHLTAGMAATSAVDPFAVVGGVHAKRGAWLWSILLWTLFTLYCVFALIQVHLHMLHAIVPRPTTRSIFF